MIGRIPRQGTPEYEWWYAGASAETAAREEGRSPAGLEVRNFVDILAERDHRMDEAAIATLAFQVYAVAGLSIWQRVRLAWRAVRRG